MLKEFKEFISRGNVVDMAVGVIIAGAFGAIITALVTNVLMPILGYLLAGVDFTNLKIVLTAATETAEEVAITYGVLIQSIISFIFIALAVFLVVKAVNKMKKPAPVVEAPPAGPTEAELLADILSELRKK